MAKKKEDIKKNDEEKEIKEINVEEEKQSADTQVQLTLSDVNNKEIYDYLKDKIDKEVKLQVQNEVQKEVKKIIRSKNRTIIKRDIVILILLVCCFFLGYNLYKISDIRIDITKTDKGNKISEVKNKEDNENKGEQEVKKEDTLEDKITKYGNLLDDIYIGEDSDYLEDFYKGNMTDEVKLYLALNHLDSEKFIVEDETTYVNLDDLKNSFEDIIDGDFNPKSFKWGADSFKYLSSKELFLFDGKFKKEKSNIQREIIDITDDDDLMITTTEGIIKDSKLYNVSGKEVKDYKDKKLIDYKESLTTVSYVFKNLGDKYKLIKISVK